jgi:putative IMPACT (imprinted ancient) family translation regulator
MLLSKDLTNILIVVVRYFGGTLLGVPGLINAYKTASLDALNNAAIVELTVNDVYAVSFDYLQMNELMKVVKEYTLTIISQNFENTCKLELEIPKAKLNVVLSKFETLAGTTFTYLRTT